ncbi:ATP-binding Cassette (ABC) Superfamily, partial [Thraustotheca clavata]
WYLDTYIAAAIGQIEIYLGFALATVCASLFKDMLIIVVSLRCSNSIHKSALRCVVAAPLFTSFDTTSVGDNLNRFSSDLGAMDMDLPYFTYQFLTDTFQTLCILLVVVYFMPIILIIVVPCGYFFISYQMFSLHTTNAVKQLDLASRESLVTCLTETLNGQATIASTGVKSEFIEKYRLAMSINGSCYGTYWLGGTWLELRLGWLSASIVTAVAFALIFLRASLDPHIAGLVLVYVISLSANIQEVLRVMSYVQTYMISVSRLITYESLEAESKDEVADLQLSAIWPKYGTIRFEKYGLKYQPHLPFALKDLSFCIQAGEKIGVCGRTGSGKSTLLSGIMRLVPFTTGAIYIDDVDISKIPLSVLRSKITVIPQHPVLFSGSIKYNLDPTNSTHTLILTSILCRIHLEHLGLDFQVEASGSNLSLGQQQQICFGRALVRRSKIIIQDEATAFMDAAMENKLQDLLMTMRYATEAIVSSRRIQEYLLTDTPITNIWPTQELDNTMCVAIEKGFFTWLSERKLIKITLHPTSSLQQPLSLSPGSNRIYHLHNISFYLPRQIDDYNAGSLIAVVGPIGSGKSSLLKALLGDMNLKSCQIFHVTSRKSYCSQKPWLINDTIRNNILLYRPYLSTLYTRVLEITNLTKDLSSMPTGDLTLVGDSGSSLSGGQCARINLARALYQNKSELYLLDDPLSALDLQVASFVFHEVRRFLKGKHVVMTMNAHHHLLQYATRVITMNNGTILRDDPVSSVNTSYPLQYDCAATERSSEEEPQNITPYSPTNNETEDNVINLRKTYLRYLSASGIYPWVALLCIMLFFTLYQILYYITD